jgi:hypothetical protein
LLFNSVISAVSLEGPGLVTMLSFPCLIHHEELDEGVRASSLDLTRNTFRRLSAV